MTRLPGAFLGEKWTQVNLQEVLKSEEIKMHLNFARVAVNDVRTGENCMGDGITQRNWGDVEKPSPR